MSAYLKALGLHVYLGTTKILYVGNNKYLGANAQALDALNHKLSKDHLYLISHCNFFCSVGHIDFSQETKDKRFGEGI